MAIDKTGWVVGRVLAAQAAARGDRAFLIAPPAAPVSFAEAHRMATRVADGLRRLGVGAGDRVAVMLPNGLDYCSTWFGINRLGAVVVAVNTGYRGAFLRHVLENSAAGTLVCAAELLDLVAEIESDLRHLRRVIVAGEGPRPAFARLPLLDFAAILGDEGAAIDDAAVSYRDLSSIMYTSGTTGPSKGVLMPHAHCYLLGLGAVENLRLTQRDAYYVCMPLFHANAMFMQVYASLIVGCPAVIVPRFSASSWLPDIRGHGCTVTNTLGVMTEFIMRQPPSPEDRDHRLRLVLAVPTPPSLAPAFRQRFGCRIMEGYGMTEVNIPLYMPLDGPARDGSCGRVYERFFEVRVVDPETDEEVSAGEVGEIVVRPREPFCFSLGYNDLPDKTVEAWRNFWFHTGDAGRRDAEGYFYFVDRIKDCIRRRGENISSFEIEAVLLAHPDVAEAAAVAVPAGIAGGEDEIKVCLVPRPGARLDPHEVAAHCQGKMPAFAVPRYIEVLDRLPRTPTEKVQKAALRAAGVAPATWDRLSGP